MILLKQSTVTTVKVGPFVDDTDAVTVEDALTIANTDVKLSKNGSALTAAHATQGTGNAAYDENGYYDIDLDATDTGELGNLRITINYIGALPVWEDCLVVTAAAYDLITEASTGGGGTVVTYTVTDDDTAAAIAGAVVQMYSDSGRTALVATATTNALGVATFSLTLGVTYYPRVHNDGVVYDKTEITVS